MRSPGHLIVAVPLAALVAAAVAGCGGGGGGSTASTPPTTTEAAPALSRADLISQGDAICAEVNAAVGSIAGSGSEASSQTGQVADLYTGMVEKIKGLGTPEATAGYSEFITAAEGLAKVEGEAKLAAERGDTAALEEAGAKAGPALEEFQSAASEYGFEKCGEEPSAPAVTGAGSGSGAAPAEEEGGVEAAPEVSEEAEVEEAAPEEVAPETGGAGGAGEEVAPEGGGTAGGETGGSSGGIGPG
jgi:hypothetical protein